MLTRPARLHPSGHLLLHLGLLLRLQLRLRLHLSLRLLLGLRLLLHLGLRLQLHALLRLLLDLRLQLSQLLDLLRLHGRHRSAGRNLLHDGRRLLGSRLGRSLQLLQPGLLCLRRPGLPDGRLFPKRTLVLS
ncbi:MAG TPA: hypothetical protein DCP91_06615 [Eggerthellaceae bacterium]|nr:hypothetical protein [Eggerthellaceae bacterium]